MKIVKRLKKAAVTMRKAMAIVHLRAVMVNLLGHDHPRQRLAAINRASVEVGSRVMAITMLATTVL